MRCGDKMANRLYGTMLKIGMIGFGGGNALVPVMEQELVIKTNAISEEDFQKDVVVANITPGALTSKVVTGVGMQFGGKKDMLLLPMLMAAPAAFLSVLLLLIMSGLEENVLTGIEAVSILVTSVVLFSLGKYIITTIIDCYGSKNRWLSIGTIFFVFFLHTMMDISSLFILLFALLLIMILAMRESFLRKTLRRGDFYWKELLAELFIWLLFVLGLSVPALVLVPGCFNFIIKGLFSGFVSFGGGAAYLGVADVIFVQGNYISEIDFVSKVVPIINVLPGSMLCKALAAIGFQYGYSLGGTVADGLLTALAGFGCSVASSGMAFCVAMHLYEHLESFTSFQTAKKWIRLIMAGLLLSVAYSICKGNLKIADGNGWNGASILLIMMVIILLLVWKERKKSGNNGLL